jgi:hypothetical protein
MSPRSSFVRCVDNTFQRDALVEGKVYEQIGEIRDGYVNIEGLGRFSAIRFVPVEEGYRE